MSSNDPDYVPDAWIESPYRRRWDEEPEPDDEHDDIAEQDGAAQKERAAACTP